MRKKCWLLFFLSIFCANNNSFVFAQYDPFGLQRSKVNFTQHHIPNRIKNRMCTTATGPTGMDWSLVGNVPGAYPTALAIAPSDPQIIYAGTWGDGVYRSLDGGESWSLTNLNDCLINNDGNAVVVAPDDADRVYVIVNNYGDYHNGGLYRTDDGGITWNKIDTGFADDNFEAALDIAPGKPNHVYFCTSDSLYFSDDWGNTWQFRHDGIYFNCLVISSQNEKTLWGSGDDSLFISTDGGIIWKGLGGTGSVINSFQVNQWNQNIMYCASFKSIFKSENGGVEWEEKPFPIGMGGFIQDFKIEQSANGDCYVATDLGMMRSDSQAENWTFINTGLHHQDVGSIAVDPTPGGPLIAGAWWGGIYKSDDRNNWRSSSSGMVHTLIYSIVSDPVFSNILYALFWGSGIYKSTDSGMIWHESNDGLTDPYVYALAIDPVNRTVLYAGTYSSGVFKSVDGGLNWNPANNALLDKEPIAAIAIDKSNPQIIYAGGDRFFRSENAGDSWTEITSGLQSSDDIITIVQDPQHFQNLYIGSWNGVFKSTDFGLNWWNTMEEGPFLGIQSLLIDSDNSNIIYIGTWGEGIYKSENSGIDWQQLEQAFSLFQYAGTMTQSKNYSNTIFAGSWGSGVFRSSNGGLFWENIGEKMKNKGVLFLDTFDDQGERLLAGTYRGIFACENPAALMKSTLLANVDKTFDLDQNYPNPFNPETIIEFTIPSPTSASLKIYNANGALVRTLMNYEPLQDGHYYKSWDAKNSDGKFVASGVYFYTLETDYCNCARRMVLFR